MVEDLSVLRGIVKQMLSDKRNRNVYASDPQSCAFWDGYEAALEWVIDQAEQMGA